MNPAQTRAISRLWLHLLFRHRRLRCSRRNIMFAILTYPYFGVLNPHFKLHILFCLAPPEFTIVECRGLHELSHEGEEVSAEGGKSARPHFSVAGREDLLHRRVHSAVRVGQENRGAWRGFEGEGDRSLPAIGESLIIPPFYRWCWMK